MNYRIYVQEIIPESSINKVIRLLCEKQQKIKIFDRKYKTSVSKSWHLFSLEIITWIQYGNPDMDSVLKSSNWFSMNSTFKWKRKKNQMEIIWRFRVYSTFLPCNFACWDIFYIQNYKTVYIVWLINSMKYRLSPTTADTKTQILNNNSGLIKPVRFIIKHYQLS